MLTQNKNKINPLSRAACIRVPKSQPSPLSMVINSLTDAGCFTSAENTQQLTQAICAANKDGENALFNAFKSREILCQKNEDSCPNIKILLDTLVKAGCFEGPNSETNKKTFIRAVLAMGRYGSVLTEAMQNPNSLKQILAFLEEAGCFANENGRQALFNALITPDSSGKTPLFYAAIDTQSFNIINEYLEHLGCLNNSKNKQNLINALFFQAKNGESSLFHASDSRERTGLMLSLLTKLGCFEGPIGSPNQQAFIRAVTAPEENNRTPIYASFGNKQILDQLMTLKYFEGPFAKENNKAIIRAILAPTKFGKKLSKNALSRHSKLSTFPVLLEHLDRAGCFWGPKLNSSKKAFLDTIFAKKSSGNCILSSIYQSDNIILLLNKLEKAGCYDDKEYSKKFRMAVRANEIMLFSVMHRMSSDYKENKNKYHKDNKLDVKGRLFDTRSDRLKDYMAFHRNLVLAGFSTQDIKNLLNKPHQESGDTPLMSALMQRNNLLAARLIADGAELTEEQKQVPRIKSLSRLQPKIARRHSLSDLSLFKAKPSLLETTPQCTQDDMDLGKKSTIRP